MSNKVVFAGCSYTAGNGWTDSEFDHSCMTECKESPYLWTNICHNKMSQLRDLELINRGQGGASNTEIFEHAISALAEHGDLVRYLICQWTAMPRYNFNPGLEVWPTNEQFRTRSNCTVKHDVHLNKGVFWSRDYITDLTQRLLVMHHLHWEIVKVVKYATAISRLCAQLGVRLLFINGLCPWDRGYFSRVPNDSKPQDLTPFTKTEILNIDSRNDEEIFFLYNKAHQDYEMQGGINPQHWLNLYDSWRRQILDRNFDNLHPGIESNQLFAKQVQTFFQSNSF
jgi:hypothetical protein